MKGCRKCGSAIKQWVLIDGKKKNLQHRKFCLICSPFGSHNTKADDPSRPSLPSGHRKTEESRIKHMADVYIRGIKRKIELVRMSGGKCIACGYSKKLRGLTFHHRNRDTKRFPLNTRELQSGGWTWDEILEEHKKCDMYCLVCHMEIESSIESQCRKFEKYLVKEGIPLDIL